MINENKNLTYCCERFKHHHQLPINFGLNIRIIQYGADVPSLTGKFGHFIIEAYNPENKNVQRFVFKYCPFCGEDVRLKYNSSEYINNTDHLFLTY